MTRKFILTDFDGTITENPSSWTLLRKRAGTPDLYPFEDFIGIRSILEFDQYFLRKTRIKDLHEVADSLSLREGASEVIPRLQKKGYGLVVVSRALMPIVNRVMDRVSKKRFECYGYTPFLFGDNWYCTPTYPEIEGTLDKEKITLDIINRKKLSRGQVVAVGDYTVDIPMFEHSDISIAMAPSPKHNSSYVWKNFKEVEEKANFKADNWFDVENIIEENLEKILSRI